MTSIIDGQYIDIQQLCVPVCLNPLGLSPSLPPNEGCICQDSFGVIYIGDGSVWIQNVNPDTVLGPASAINNNLAAFDGTTGKVLKDSGLATADIVTVAAGTMTNLASFTSGTTIADSGISVSSIPSCISTTISPITMTSNAGTNPNMLACSLYLQRIITGSEIFVSFELEINQTIVTATLPDVWYCPALVPVQYRPTAAKNFVCSVYSNVTSNLIPGCEFVIQSSGIVDIFIYNSTTVGSTLFQNYSGVYRIV
jgi:hypothetical protein